MLETMNGEIKRMSNPVGKQAEFYSIKPKTIICDLDGTILNHFHRFSDLNKFDPELLSGVKNKFDEWDSLNHKIILMTARKESARKMTEEHLRQLGIPWDQLIMGVFGGERILINDKLLEEDTDRAIAINVITNKGFENINWKDMGL
jgi:hydroxymethylpyrimidine pyrophosphatase-like HAD family hydrolase